MTKIQMLLFAYAYLSDVKGFVWRQSERRIFCALTSVGALFIFTFLEEVKIMETIRGWYANIGKKIKTLAIWTFIIAAIACIISGIIMMLSNEGAAFIPGAFFMVLGSIAAFISSWTLYAFGELVDNSQTIAERLNPENVPLKSKESYLCPNCDEDIEKGCLECPKCGQKIEW